jgi:hypothetical protein
MCGSRAINISLSNIEFFCRKELGACLCPCASVQCNIVSNSQIKEYFGEAKQFVYGSRTSSTRQKRENIQRKRQLENQILEYLHTINNVSV